MGSTGGAGVHSSEQRGWRDVGGRGAWLVSWCPAPVFFSSPELALASPMTLRLRRRQRMW